MIDEGCDCDASDDEWYIYYDSSCLSLLLLYRFLLTSTVVVLIYSRRLPVAACFERRDHAYTGVLYCVLYSGIMIWNLKILSPA
jgi:hypothetical protein